MYKILLGLMVLSLFVGCTSKEEKALLKSYHAKTQYHKHLQRTEKQDIFKENTLLATITATYMNIANFAKKDTRDEVFIVGVHFEDTDTAKIFFDKNSTLLAENEYTLTLNHKNAISVTHLDNKDKKLSSISFITDWGDYYEVKFPHAGKRFKLVFENGANQKVDLDFSKVAKFVYTKKGF